MYPSIAGSGLLCDSNWRMQNPEVKNDRTAGEYNAVCVFSVGVAGSSLGCTHLLLFVIYEQPASVRKSCIVYIVLRKAFVYVWKMTNALPRKVKPIVRLGVYQRRILKRIDF